MQSVDSNFSKASQNAQTIISKLASRDGNQKSLLSIMDEEVISKVWSSFGLYLSRQLRMGRGVVIKNFGTFGFSAPEVTLDGVTNPIDRDSQLRVPVFLIAKNFIKGKNLRTAVAVTGQKQLRPYQCQTSGLIQQTIINYAEIASYSNETKDVAKSGVERVLRAVSDMNRNNQNIEIEIPGVGAFLIRGDLAGIQFSEGLISQCRGITKRPLSERRQRGLMNLNSQYLLKLGQSAPKIQEDFQIDERTKNYLSGNLGVNIDHIMGPQRPKTAKFTTTVQQVDQRPLSSVCGNKSTFTREICDDTYGMERLKYYIREASLNFEDAFLDLATNAFGRTSHRKIKLSKEDFKKAINNIQLPLTQNQIEILFDKLDLNHDGYIDKSDFISAIDHQKSHINYIKDVVYKFQLHTDDFLQRMNLNRDHPPLNAQALKRAIQNLDESLNQFKALKIVKEILGNQQTITIEQLVTLFNTVEEDDKQYDASWFKDTLYRLHNRLSTTQFNKLKEQFEYFDEHQIGNLDTANFKTVIMESNLGLSVQDINRMVRYIPKTNGSLINYYQFLAMIQDVVKRADQADIAKDVVDFAQKLQKYLTQHHLNVRQFLLNVRQKSQTSTVKPQNLAIYVKENIFTALSIEDCQKLSEEVDIDGDGIISQEDLTIFISRSLYFMSGARKAQEELTQISKFKSQNSIAFDNPLTQIEQTFVSTKSMDVFGKPPMTQLMKVLPNSQTKTLNPIDPMSEDKFDKILKDLRHKLMMKGLSYEDFFNLLDMDHKGFITPSNFCENIEKIISLSQPAKDGFFAFIDKQCNGLIDLNSFMGAMNKTIVEKAPVLTEDNYDWEMDAIFKIRNWQQREGLTVEDAFRTIDRDFDGEISKQDLRSFLTDVLMLPQNIITQGKINRLFKILDQFKRGHVTLFDFKRFLEEGVFFGQNKIIFGDPQSKGNETLSAKKLTSLRSSFDWKINARQQIGLVISRHFPSVKQSFDIISGYQKRLVFAAFKKWIDSQNTLSGFDLTEKLLYSLFSDIDQHKKGYVNETDWINAFSHYSNLDSMLQEIQASLKVNFKSFNEALIFFLDNQPQITKDSFIKALESLFPKRFLESDLQQLWNKISKNDQITPNAFQLIFQVKDSPWQKSDSIVLNISRAPLIDRLRRFLRNSKLNLKQLCQQYDQDNKGFITNIEFRQVLRSLAMGLTLQEIDIICQMCTVDTKSQINYLQFVNVLKVRQVDNRILDRAGVHLKVLNDHCYNYLISPKDAFRQSDSTKQGQLTFQQFEQLCNVLYNLAREDVPPFAIIKDLFEFIDKRQDGLIDMTEWMDAFQQYSNPNVMQKRPMTSLNNRKTGRKSFSDAKSLGSVEQYEGLTSNGLLNANTKFQSFLRKPIKAPRLLQFQDNLWESSKDFDKIITAIGKNRKYLNDIFKQLSQNGTVPLKEETIKNEIDKMLRSQGIIVQDEQWFSLMAWAKKNNTVDYKFLLSVYKDRINSMDTQPRNLDVDVL